MDLFCPPIRSWFAAALGEPTEAQELAWPHIAAGAHALVTAPTGSGKTLTAFLWALDRLLGGHWTGGRVRVLYVSPLRALGNDVRRNLLTPLAELAPHFAEHGLNMPTVRVASRTGDTPPDERRRMIRQPPEILITTPESLNILLTSDSGRGLLGDLETVIVDEVHAVVSSKRGIHLITAVDRLVALSGEFQRIGLSATVRPLDAVAAWLGGHRLTDDGDDPVYRPRQVVTVAAPSGKQHALEVALPEVSEHEGVWADLTMRLRRTVHRNRSTLVFANSKRAVEKVARLVNEQEQAHLAYSHHGALSRELRAVVEERLKRGELKAIVATNSLELGIDIGTIDEVAMVAAPPSVASTLQRLGRSGHGVGLTSRGTLYALHDRDLLQAAVLTRAALDGDIEATPPLEGALDVLAQVLVSMVVSETWSIDRLYAAIRASAPYHGLSRRLFDLVLDMLTGRFATVRLRTLRPLVAVDRIDGTVRARRGARQLLYLAGGTIPDRGYYRLRLAGDDSALGELDEEFVWERSVGDTFTLGVQSWRVERITHNDVLVTPAARHAAMAPFWRADERDRSSFLSLKVADFLEEAEHRLDDDEWPDHLCSVHQLEPDTARSLVRYLHTQRSATGVLPHRHRVVVEHTAAEGRDGHRRIILHTVWGGRVNRPLANALSAAWTERHGPRPEVVHDDDCIALTVPAELDGEEVLALVEPGQIEALLRRHLEGTGFFGARFREAAGCALLLPRAGFRRRTPLWLNRQRAKELLEAVSPAGDFPLVVEAWRSCLQDEFELAALAERLDEVRDGRVEVHHVRTTSPSPFTGGVVWKQTNTLMYEDDVPMTGGRAGIRPDLLREVALSAHLRPAIDPSLVAVLEGKLQRTAPGYAPRTAEELLDWVGERLLIPDGEWQTLLAAMEAEAAEAPEQLMESLGERLVRVELAAGATPVTATLESIARLVVATGLDPGALELTDGVAQSIDRLVGELGREDQAIELADLVAEWLHFCGPITPQTAERTFARPLAAVLEELADAGVVVIDELTADGPGTEVCDRLNLERLLRMARAEARPPFEPLAADLLPLHLAHHQGLGRHDAALADLRSALEPLFGWGAPAGLWETELLPARLEPYLPSWTDSLLSETELEWFGCGPETIGFALAPDRDLYAAPDQDQTAADVLPDIPGRFTLSDLSAHAGADPAELTRRLWRAAWSGVVSTDTLAPLRQGIESSFEPIEERPRARARRRGFERWRSSRPFAGNWYRLRPAVPPADALEADEQDRERARTLLDRHGVVFRELLEREPPELRWGRLFRSLRLLELAGEAVTGRFFAGVPGLQFATPSVARRLADGLDEDLVWWVNACDPASPCGLRVDGLDADLPRRLPGNHVVFHGRRLVVVSERRGRRLRLRVAPDHPHLLDYLEFLELQLTRAVRPRSAVVVDTINEDPATSSPYRQALERRFHVTRTATSLRLARRY
jgi:ATP-dependent Lhr-like helicase